MLKKIFGTCIIIGTIIIVAVCYSSKEYHLARNEAIVQVTNIDSNGVIVDVIEGDPLRGEGVRIRPDLGISFFELEIGDTIKIMYSVSSGKESGTPAVYVTQLTPYNKS